MAFTKKHRTPTQLTADARAAVRVILEQYFVSGFLPSRNNPSLNFQFDVNQTSLPAAARFRSFNSAADVGTTDGSENRSGKLPPISRRLHVDEATELALYGNGALIGDKFKEYAQRIATQIAARVVLAQGEAIETGKVTINERGISATIDYGRKASHTANAASGWWSSTGTATPLADLEAARAVYGKDPATTLLSPEIVAALQKNEDMMNLILGRGDNLPSRVSREDVLSFLTSEGFGQVVVNNDQLIGTTGVTKRVISEKKVVFLPSADVPVLGGGGALGTTDWGITAEAINSDNGIPSGERAGVYSGALESHDPEGFDVLVSAITLPVVTSADSTFALQVLA
ncbi:major capsid protein [Agromyces atrinae]|uniref:major capsid protein n=1 Tax=Agromyces atrinae TaxID=592376 RepID=UPI001F581FC9|nr:major capsid protein [Agromyces atrinae]MCI2958246.1 major capsid protein [Agromyces atrinae]